MEINNNKDDLLRKYAKELDSKDLPMNTFGLSERSREFLKLLSDYTHDFYKVYEEQKEILEKDESSKGLIR